MLRSTIMLLAAMLGLGACSTPPGAMEASGGPTGIAPPDLFIDLLVIAPDRGVANAPVEDRDGRFVLFADGTLCHSEDPAARPPVVRVLSRQEVDRVWSMLESNDLTPWTGTRAGNPNLVPADVERPRRILTVAGSERSSQHLDGDEPDGLVDVTRYLAALAWIADDPAASRIPPPTRYDVGPDPYAQYRTGTTP